MPRGFIWLVLITEIGVSDLVGVVPQWQSLKLKFLKSYNGDMIIKVTQRATLIIHNYSKKECKSSSNLQVGINRKCKKYNDSNNDTQA